MPIIVSSGESNQIEVSIRYLDKGSKGIYVFLMDHQLYKQWNKQYWFSLEENIRLDSNNCKHIIEAIPVEN